MVIDNSFYLSLAIKEAWRYQGLTYPNPAVGCVILSSSGEILAIEAHKCAGEAHAEVEALKSAYIKLTNDETLKDITSSAKIHEYLLKNHNNTFKDCTVYVTLEPCSHEGKTPSCAILLTFLGLKKVIIGSLDFNSKGGVAILKKAGIEVESEVLKDECNNLLEPFRHFLEDRFVFFKWASRLNGSVDGGTISSLSSREHVHKLRDKCDLLVIGGGSVRSDRPTLDARLVGGRAPDVLIYSKRDDFDKTIPLFNIKNRKVFIESSFDRLSEYKNILIEGGAQMFEATKDIASHYLAFLAPSVSKNSFIFNSEVNFEILNAIKDEQDIIMWMKKV